MLSIQQQLIFVFLFFGGLSPKRRRGDIKLHTLYDVETHIPTFIHITNVSTHDSKAMSEMPYEQGSYFGFERAYNNF